MSFFTSPTFSWIMAAVCGVAGVLCLLGRGRGFLELFTTRTGAENKRTPEQERTYQRTIGIFLLVLCANEILLALFGHTVRWLPFLTIAIVVVGLIFTGWKLRNIS